MSCAIIILQAEDGIRDLTVTGVQTCALPISSLPPGNYEFTVSKRGFKGIVKPGVTLHVADTISMNFNMVVGELTEKVTVEAGAERSEERRVGKESRSRWSPYH